MKPLTKQFIDIALAEVGNKEEGGNNLGEAVVKYQKATWLKPAAWPWCCAFVAWVLQEFINDNVPALINFKLKSNASNYWRCKGANTNDWLVWARKHNFYITDEKEQAKAGDIVIFDFSHIGIVIADQLPGKDYIETVEGNTNGKGERDSFSGDGVWLKTRKTNLVKNYIRFLPQEDAWAELDKDKSWGKSPDKPIQL